MLRLVLVVLAIALFLILTVPILPILWLIGKRWPHARDIASLRMVQWIFKVICILAGTRVTVIGEDRIPRDQAVLYIGNHRSFFDVVITYARCPSLTGYIAKKELAGIPLLSLWMKRLYCLFLDRQDIKAGLKTILTAIDYVKSGISIMIFPEGTRSKEADETELLPFHDGSFKVASKSGCPIIPVTISHTSSILEDHFPWIRAAHVIVEYGEPIDLGLLTGDDRKFPGRYVRSVIQQTLIKEPKADHE